MEVTVSQGKQRMSSVDEAMDRVLGVHLNRQQDWSDITHGLCKKGQSWLHLLGRLRWSGWRGPAVAPVLLLLPRPLPISCWCVESIRTG